MVQRTILILFTVYECILEDHFTLGVLDQYLIDVSVTGVNSHALFGHVEPDIFLVTPQVTVLCPVICLVQVTRVWIRSIGSAVLVLSEARLELLR